MSGMRASRVLTSICICLALVCKSYSQTCTVTTDPSTIHMMVSALTALWNYSRGDPDRRRELQSVIGKARKVLELKKSLISDCGKFANSSKSNDWTTDQALFE